MSKNNIQVLKGFRDYLPSEQIARKKIIGKISQVFERFGFAPIDTPSLESYELFKGKLGEDEKLMYKFKDLGDREIALRYDLTVPLARLVANNPSLPKPFKRYIIGNSWRAENTQKGRFREFVQCDIDVVGSDSILADVDVIAAMNAAYKSLEVGEVIVKFNDRRLVDEVLAELEIPKAKHVVFMRWLDKLEKIGTEKVKAGLISEGIDGDVLVAYKKQMESKFDAVSEMQSLLNQTGVEFAQFTPTLMRGLDYYTGWIFEFVLKDKPEFGSIGGGGRYDNLIEKVSGIEMPAVGGSIGLDRMFAALQDAGLIAPQTAAEVLVMNLDADMQSDYLKMTTQLRDAGIDTEIFYEPSKLDKQFKFAESKNMKIAVIYGADESKSKQVNIKDLTTKKQTTVDLDDLVSQVKSMIWRTEA